MRIHYNLLVALLLAAGVVRSSDSPARRYKKNARRMPTSEPSMDAQVGRFQQQGSDYDYSRTEPYEQSYIDQGAPAHDAANALPKDVIDQYTETVPAKLLICLFSTVFTTTVTAFLSLMLTSRLSPIIVLIVASIIGVASFRKTSDLGNLSRAFGVITLLLIRRANLSIFLSRLLQFTKGVFNIGRRRPYPPSENPWQYKASRDDPNSINFSMYSTILVVAVVGSSIGSSIAKPIPLFPNWIGALLAAGFCSYLTTLRDSRGDLLRFIGNSGVGCWSAFYEVSQEVDLWSKLNKVSGKSLAQLSRLDEKYNFIGKLKFLISLVTSRVASESDRVMNDLSSAKNEDSRQYSNDGNYDDRGRYKDRSGKRQYYREDDHPGTSGTFGYDRNRNQNGGNDGGDTRDFSNYDYDGTSRRR
jgi:hypothetical protein